MTSKDHSLTNPIFLEDKPDSSSVVNDISLEYQIDGEISTSTLIKKGVQEIMESPKGVLIYLDKEQNIVPFSHQL